MIQSLGIGNLCLINLKFTKYVYVYSYVIKKQNYELKNFNMTLYIYINIYYSK